MIKQSLNFETAPGYEILAAVGKTVLRPGGRAATEQLFQWANFKFGKTVLELASFKEFADRGHSLVLDSGWRELAEYSLGWLRSKHL